MFKFLKIMALNIKEKCSKDIQGKNCLMYLHQK
jgi:hypothetical protein